MVPERTVFERGVKAISLSVDLWIHYINFFKEQYGDEGDCEHSLRELYERAVLSSGLEFRSDKLWLMYLSWEKDSKRLKNLTALYDRLLGIPTQLYSHHFEKFQEHVNNNLPRDILTTDEFLSLRREIVSKNEILDNDEAAGMESPPPPGVDDPSAVDDIPPGESPPGLESSIDDLQGKILDSETIALREKIIEHRLIVHKTNEEEVSRRWAFEEGIKRPYFHVKPLERTQLKNWREYLDFEIENGYHERVVVLFERCLIACALYEDFWTKYAKYLEPHSEEEARNVYQRACHIHLPKKPNIHISWAAFEERLGFYTTSWEILSSLEKLVPGLIMVTLRRISLERRQGNFEEVEELYKYYIEKSESPDVASFYAQKFARYYLKYRVDKEKAKEILNAAIEKDMDNSKLYVQLIDLEYQNTPIVEEEILRIFEIALQSNMDVECKIKFSRRKVEFLEDFGSDINRIQEAYEEHSKLLKLQTYSRKRIHEGQGDDGSLEKKVRIESNGTIASTIPSSATATTTTDATALAYYSTSPWSSYAHTNPYSYHQSAWNAYSSQYYTQPQ